MSLRARLLTGMAVVGVVLVVAAIVITRSTEAYLIERVDAQLVAAKPSVQGVGFERGGPGARNFPDANPGGSLNTLYVGIVAGDTIRTQAMPAFEVADAPVPDISADQARASADNGGQPFTVGTNPPSDTRYRAVAYNSRDGDQTIVTALSLADVDASVSRLIWVEVIITGLVLGILAVVTWWVIRLGVRPVKQMTATATAIAGGDLSHRVPTGHEGTEAGELGDALNTMLTRIEEAFDERSASEARLRQFIADASHELRTPVATIRGYAELYRRGGLEEHDALEQAMRRTEAETLRMGSLIDDLLLLARLDQGRPLDQTPVDLGVLAVDAAADARARAPERRVTASVSEGVMVNGDEHRLRQLVANLVGNALVHTPPDAPIEARVRSDNGTAVLEVHDDGPGMSPDVAARAFERFYRADPSRSRHHGGSGLGLAIVRAIVDAHGGTVTLDTTLGHGTTVRVQLPKLPAAAVVE
jgi:two-component system OmpR family sensor kinase